MESIGAFAKVIKAKPSVTEAHAARGEDSQPKPVQHAPASHQAARFAEGEEVMAKWHQQAKDGNFHFYPATVESVHFNGKEYTLRWKDTDGFAPTVRLDDCDVKKIVAPPPKRKRVSHLSAGEKKPAKPAQEWGISLPERTLSGRKVARVTKFVPRDDDIQKIARQIEQKEARERKQAEYGEWIGEPTKKVGERVYYSAVKLSGGDVVVREGDCVIMRANKSWGGGLGVADPLPWLALVRDLFHDTYSETMMSTILWFNRPEDCSPQSLPGGTLKDEEVLLTEASDVNSIRSFLGILGVLGEKDFAAAKRRIGDGEVFKVADGREAALIMMCRYTYDAKWHSVTPIMDTKAVLKQAASGRLMDKHIAGYIRDFQRAWVACLRKVAARKGGSFSPEDVEQIDSKETSPSPSSKQELFEIEASEVPLNSRKRPQDECKGGDKKKAKPAGNLQLRRGRAPSGEGSCAVVRCGAAQSNWNKDGPLEFSFGEYVEAKWDDGFYYQALIVRRVMKKHGQFSAVLVEWLDPDGFPSYWESSGYERSKVVSASQVRNARQPPPKHLTVPGIGYARVENGDEEDWDLAAKRAEEGVCKADGGVEWYPRLDTRKQVLAAKGHQSMWVCTHAMCGRAFADMYFLRAHQLSCRHGRWNGLQPLMSEGGRKSVKEVDCIRSGHLEFVSSCVEKKLRKFVVQKKGSEEPRLDDDLPVLGKVLHTGDAAKGFGLYATRDIKEGTFLGHYSGAITQIGYTKRGKSWHYMFHLLHGIGVDGTAGGAFRFMNHCLENQDPSVRALIVNHKGVPHVALYANRGIEAGEELLLRYGEVSDSQFFGEECGQD